MPDKKVMIVDDDRGIVQVLGARLRALGLEVRGAHDGMTAIKLIPQFEPDLILLDVNMPAGGGLTVCAVLAEDQELAPIPVVVLTGQSDDETIRRCEELGAHYVKKSTDVWDRLQPLVSELLELNDRSSTTAAASERAATVQHDEVLADRPTVLAIDDDPDISKALQIKLRPYGVNVLRAFNGMQGYWTALREKPDIIICDFEMPEGKGNYILGRLKSHTITANTPIFILTGRTIGGHRDHALERDLKALGATAFLAKPIDFATLLAELQKHITLRSPEGVLAE